MKKRIGIVVIGTNSYILLSVRFIKKFQHHYKGESEIIFNLFTDNYPMEYFSLKECKSIRPITTKHSSWRDATNSKFDNILRLKDDDFDSIYYFDADSDINKDFTEEWFDVEKGLVGGEHYGNRDFLSGGKGFDRNPIGNSYVPIDSILPYTYYYGAFFGGSKEELLTFCTQLSKWQKEDTAIGYEPPVNDESYINKYFHFNPPNKTVKTEEFAFVISDKGGINNMRDININIEDLKRQARENKDKLYNISNGKLIVIE